MNNIKLIYECELFEVLYFTADTKFCREYLAGTLIVDYNEIPDVYYEKVLSYITEIEMNGNIPCLLLIDSFDTKVLYYDLDLHVLSYGNYGNIVELEPDFDNEILDKKICGNDTLRTFLNRIECMKTFIIYTKTHNCQIKDAYLDFCFKLYDLSYFCSAVRNNLINRIRKVFKNNDRVSFDYSASRYNMYNTIYALSYLYIDIRRYIEENYPVKSEGYQSYYTTLFNVEPYSAYVKKLDCVMRTIEYESEEFMSKLAEGLLDADFISNFSGSRLLDTNFDRTLLYQGFFDCFDNFSERDLIFGQCGQNIKSVFTPNMSALRLATLQSDVDIFFIASLMWYIRQYTLLKSIVIDDVTFYDGVDYSETYYLTGNLTIESEFRFSDIFNKGSVTKEFHMNLKVFNNIKKFLKYAFASFLERLPSSALFEFHHDSLAIDAEDIEIYLSDDRASLIFIYQHYESEEVYE